MVDLSVCLNHHLWGSGCRSAMLPLFPLSYWRRRGLWTISSFSCYCSAHAFFGMQDSLYIFMCRRNYISKYIMRLFLASVSPIHLFVSPPESWSQFAAINVAFSLWMILTSPAYVLELWAFFFYFKGAGAPTSAVLLKEMQHYSFTPSFVCFFSSFFNELYLFMFVEKSNKYNAGQSPSVV